MTSSDNDKPQTATSTLTMTTPQNDTKDRSIFSPRSRHQLGIFFAGSSFVIISSLLTRRSIHRRYTVTKPPFFHANMTPLLEINGGLEALDALFVATVNVFSYAIMVGGGLFWAFDINSLTELKQRAKMKGADELAKVLAEEEQGPESDIGNWPAAAIAMHEEDQRKLGDEDAGPTAVLVKMKEENAVKTSRPAVLSTLKQELDRRREG